MADEILTIDEVAKYLKLAKKTAYRLVAEGKLPVLRWVEVGDLSSPIWIDKQTKITRGDDLGSKS